jgi:hypothetical protein
MVTADQLLIHALGDYILQTNWMANEKTKRSTAAIAHVVTYTIPFLALTQSWKALAVILVTHFAIDRWRLARFVVFSKNWIGGERRPWSECSGTGYHSSLPPFMAVWLMIIADNVMHVTINGLALRYL